MIHIVYNKADVAVIENVQLLDASLAGTILSIDDDYAVGPIQELHTTLGQANRKDWWHTVLQGGDYDMEATGHIVDDYATIHTITDTLHNNEAEIVWIWCAQNAHDVSGYYWLISQLKQWQGRVYILYLNNLPFFNEKKQLFYPNYIHQIPAAECLKAKHLARPVTASELEIDPDEWAKLAQDYKEVRTLEGGKKLQQHTADYYDQQLQSFITKDYSKASKLIQQYLTKSKDITGDAYLLWRLKHIAAQEQYEVQGILGKMKEFEVRKIS